MNYILQTNTIFEIRILRKHALPLLHCFVEFAVCIVVFMVCTCVDVMALHKKYL